VRRIGLLLLLGAAAGAGDWPVRGGNAARNRLGEELDEELPRRPLWRFSLRERDDRFVVWRGKWVRIMRNREPAPAPEGVVEPSLDLAYPANHPVVARGLLLFRDGVEMGARHVGSGAFVPLRGRYYSPLDVNAEVPARFVRPVNRFRTEDWYRSLAYGWGTLTVAGGRFVCVEKGSPTLYAVYERNTGRTLWAWRAELSAGVVRADPQAFAAWNKDHGGHAGAHFLGPGVAVGGRLFTVVLSAAGEVFLWCFDLERGEVSFRTRLKCPPVRPHLRSQPEGAAIAHDRGTLFVTTPAQTFHIIDVANPAKPRTTIDLDRRQPGFAFHDPIVVGDRVLVAAPGAKGVTCVHRDGKVLWTYLPHRLGGLYHIAGVSGDVVVLAGSRAVGLDLATGKLKWGPVPLLSGEPFGRGFVATRHAYLPTRSKQGAFIERIRIADGHVVRPLRFDVRKLGNLLSHEGRLLVANADEVMCFSTAERELIRTWDPLERARLLRLAGRPKQAAQAFVATGDQRLAVSELLEMARRHRDRAYVDLARKLARSAEYKAWAALVEAQLTGDTTLLRTTYKSTKVPYRGAIITGATAAQRLEAR